MSDVIIALLPGMMYFWVLFVGQTPLQEIAFEQEGRTLARILVAPVTLAQFVLSKLVRCFLLCLLVQASLLVLSAVLFSIRWGTWWQLGIALGVNALSMTGFLGLIYSLARTKEQANVIAPLATLTAALLGGCMFPFDQLPAFMQAIGRCTPNRWGVLSLQTVIQGRPLAEALLPWGIQCGFGAVTSLAAFGLFQRQFTRGGGR